MRARAFLCCSIVAFLSHTQALSFAYSCSTPTHIRRPTHFHQHAESWSNPVFFVDIAKSNSKTGHEREKNLTGKKNRVRVRIVQNSFDRDARVVEISFVKPAVGVCVCVW